MILQITEEMRINSDAYNWTVEQKYIPQKGKQAGETTWVTKSYHPTIEQAVKAVYDLRLRLIDAEGVVDTLKAIKALQMDVRALQEKFQCA